MPPPPDPNPPTALPTIDISPFLHPPTPTTIPLRHRTATALAHACANPGFFYLTHHSIPPSTLSHLLALSRAFFLSTPAAAKAAIARGRSTSSSDTTGSTTGSSGSATGDTARGYQRIGENITAGARDWHEALDLYAAAETGPGRGSGVLGGENVWPEQPEELRGVVEGYVGAVREVGEAVVRAMGEALGLGEDEGDGEEEDAEVFVRATERSFWVMRLIGYPGLPGEGEEGVSCGEHTDYGCVTLLLADETPGALQVQRRDGSWIAADPVPGAFVVNIGDMMERWTNGLWRSTKHRVIHRGAEYRVSAPFFFEPNFDARVRPLRKCVAETGGEAKYDEVVYGDHLLAKIKGNFY